MDQKRLILAIAISIAILLGYQVVIRPYLPEQPAPAQTSEVQASKQAPATSARKPPSDTIGATAADKGNAQVPPPREVPRVKIEAPRLQGSISLVGARLDDVVLRDYHETVDKNSPLVRLLEPLGEKQPYYIQFGWSVPQGETIQGAKIKLPGPDTLWTASSNEVTNTQGSTLSWDNGQGLTFQIKLSVDDNYMFTVDQQVKNATDAPVQLYPWSRIRRDYTPETSGYYLLHEGLLGVLGGTLHEITYKQAKSDAEKHDGVAMESTGEGGWAGITDKYWLAALIPDQKISATATMRHVTVDGHDGYQVDYVSTTPDKIAPGATSGTTSRVFVGAKEVHLLAHYEAEGIPLFSYAVDFGWFWFLTKPIFYALDWLNSLLGNFGLAIMAFTLFVKAAFFPLANRSYRSMSKMKLLGPKMTALRERFKDDPAKLQQEMMQLYKAEKVNPVSGCLPMLIQVPIFWALYKNLYVTIEMRHAPFFGWIRDLSAIDPTNVFNLFGLLPFDPTTISPFLHLGAWPLIMGVTMWMQQRLNPPPPDPTQAKLFQLMPIIFTFMLARFPAGLVIYWSWNNTLTFVQQWLILRRTKLTKPGMART